MLKNSITWPNEVVQLIAEGSSTSSEATSIAALLGARSSAQRSLSSRAVEPSASATDIILPKPKSSNSLEALTTPLSVANVTQTQDLSKASPNEVAPVEIKEPISLDKQFNHQSNPSDIIDKRKSTHLTTIVAKEEADVSRDKASAAGPKLIFDEDKKGPDGLTEVHRQKVKELKRRDAEVRAHEQSHTAIGGPYAGPLVFALSAALMASSMQSLAKSRSTRQPSQVTPAPLFAKCNKLNGPHWHLRNLLHKIAALQQRLREKSFKRVRKF